MLKDNNVGLLLAADTQVENFLRIFGGGSALWRRS